MNQVAKKEKSDVALAGMFEEDANTSFSNMGSDDFALPFLRVLGQLSPETNKRDAKYVEGAEPRSRQRYHQRYDTRCKLQR
jgi:hypothetical protein